MKNIIFFLSTFLVISCNNNSSSSKAAEQTKTQEKSIQLEKDIINTPIGYSKSFYKDLKDKPKIFLKYWSGMTIEDYNNVSEILFKEGTLEKYGALDYYYLSDKCKAVFKPIFKDDLIIGIKMYDNIDCIYPLFQKKYKLPNMVKKSRLNAHYIENNPKYKPETSYFDGSNFVSLPDAFIDKTSRLQANTVKKLSTETINSIYTENKFYKDEFTIDNGSTVIIFKQKVSSNKSGDFYKYSLDESNEMKEYMENLNSLNSLDKNKNNELKYIECNSKTRTVIASSNTYKTITYMSKKDYVILTSESKNQADKENNKMLLEQQQKKERSKKSYNEI